MILVTGATGLNGSELVRRLSARGVRVRAPVRNPAKAAPLAALPNVEIAEGDMARFETLSGPLQGVERAMLISTSAPDMLDIQSSFEVIPTIFGWQPTRFDEFAARNAAIFRGEQAAPRV